jgi:CRISPR/Cas system CMR-associated protein Cmr1 (group 7 of RAMP superfamily)
VATLINYQCNKSSSRHHQPSIEITLAFIITFQMIEEASQSVTELGIAPLVARSLSSFKTLTSTVQCDHAQVSQVSSYLARFKLWAGNLGAHRRSGGGSLEYRLRDASHIRKLVISLLQDLCRSIEQGIDFLSSIKRKILTTSQLP